MAKKSSPQQPKWLYPLVYGVLIVVNLLPSYAEKPYLPQETQDVILNLLMVAVAPYAPYAPVFHLATVVIILLVFLKPGKMGRLVAGYVGVNYLVIALAQSMGQTQKYGFVVHIAALATMLLLGGTWLVVAFRDDIRPTFRKLTLPEYGLLGLALLAYWSPYAVTDGVIHPDFNPLLLVTSPDYGLTFCFTTPILLMGLILFYPQVNQFAYRITAFSGLLYGLFNLTHWFNPDTRWMGFLHLPLLILSTYALFLPRVARWRNRKGLALVVLVSLLATGCGAVAPTATSVPATATQIAPGATNTPLAPTATPAPPTATAVPPTPTATPVPPTALPSATPTPAPLLLLENSPQSFGRTETFQVGLGDLDGDGDLDAVFANMAANDSQVWFNDGQGTFQDSGQKLTQQGHGLGLGDLDGDGDLDIFMTCAHFGSGGGWSKKPSRVYLNDGQGTFEDSGQDLGDAELSGNGVNLIDLDGDGDLDAHVIYYEVGGMADRVYLNDGAGRFNDSGLALEQEEIAWGDLDADGDLDMLAKAYGEGYRVLLNDGERANLSPAGRWRTPKPCMATWPWPTWTAIATWMP